MALFPHSWLATATLNQSGGGGRGRGAVPSISSCERIQKKGRGDELSSSQNTGGEKGASSISAQRYRLNEKLDTMAKQSRLKLRIMQRWRRGTILIPVSFGNDDIVEKKEEKSER